jgi:hypothetical protein
LNIYFSARLLAVEENRDVHRHIAYATARLVPPDFCRKVAHTTELSDLFILLLVTPHKAFSSSKFTPAVSTSKRNSHFAGLVSSGNLVELTSRTEVSRSLRFYVIATGSLMD